MLKYAFSTFIVILIFANALIFLSCSRTAFLNVIDGYILTPVICEFDSAYSQYGKLRKIEFICELPDTSLWFICGNSIQKADCYDYSNNMHTLYSKFSCEDIVIISRDKKIYTKVPLFKMRWNITVNLVSSVIKDGFSKEYSNYFYARYW